MKPSSFALSLGKLLLLMVCFQARAQTETTADSLATTVVPPQSEQTQSTASIQMETDELVRLFFAAARTGQVEVLHTFLDAGFPINQRNSQSYTALMVAAYYGQQAATTLLLHRGADACLQDKRGNTAVMGALFKGEFSLARQLYQSPCDASLRNNAGLTLEQFAATYTQQGMAHLTTSQHLATEQPDTE
ncbi:ankyrin repeat domain-containing protein [Vibrio sp. PP-XX7]